ncbi:transport protein Trs120 or TRAPPC9 TRAPP II complex subunit-domain-containing protein [Chaetomidium leptoderma]|uniref:p-aminobenzoic acid synthase n=1 Tax=Chaetomidium leptoderma TaxID=669021 RepID=A0AAN6ZYA0_9PEZI|nr:transport protein Trs120 or TRAPPC9 TRAPP II complex subunit-domain-containing protein [Chaetomidium leptoderma]
MTVDPLLPVTPARVKALVLPIGRIKRERFTAFVERLHGESVVFLRDVTPDARPHRNMFSPLAFPDGAMFYDLMMHHPPPSHLALSPFDLFREPLAVIAIADGAELPKTVFSKRHSSGKTVEEANIRALYQDLEDLRDRYPKVLAHQVLLFDYLPDKETPVPIPEGIITIPPAEQLKRTTIKTVMCDISALILAEMTTLARSYEGMSFIDSPGHSSARPMNAMDDPTAVSRRNSQFSLPANRSSSTSGLPDRSHVRMSMPPVPSKGIAPSISTSSTPGRPSTPVSNNKPLPSPPSTFDSIIGVMDPPTSPEQAGLSRPDTADGFRTQSQDRVSVQGFGPGGLNERWRSKGRCRVQVVVGSLYLQAGLWNNALKELTEAATIAKSINDHLWHGKALELILVNLLLLGWAGIEFQVPSIVLPPHDKGAGPGMALQEAEARDPSQPRWLRNLQVYIPELLDRIMGLYSRISSEHLLPLPFSEAVIRFCRILSAMHTANGRLCPESFEMIVFGVPPKIPLTTSPRFTIQPTRTLIVATLFKAFPASSSELLTTVDRIVILSGIASVLGHLGFQRKKAMVVRELVSVLVGGLVEARTRGAADVGIHPAAGLVGLNGASARDGAGGALELAEGDIEHGIDSFLGLMLKTYGVVGSNVSGESEDNSDAAVVERIQKQSAARFFGMRGVKINILRVCINFSEALPDFAGVLKYSSDLLRTAGSGIAPGPRRENAYPSITREEQVRLVTNVLKTSSLSKRLGIGALTAEYWDEFLIRGITLEALPPSRTPVPHAKTVLPGITAARSSQDVDPFIYNPFLKRPDTATVDRILVAGEPANFRLTLQNPYEVEVELESIRLDTEGAEFESAVETTAIGAYRTQIMRISGTPKSAGTVKVTGALIKVRGCRERRFPIFTDPWSPEDELKVKAIGLGALDVNAAAVSPAIQRLKPENIELNVIAPQPVVVVKSSTLPQSSVMILEGERQCFSITLQNLSTTTPVDFLLFSFKDSTQEPLQLALSNRDATATELYEYELVLAKKQPLRLKNRDDSKRFIAPGQTATFDFELLGRPGLTHGLIHVDYAHLGVPHGEVAEKFYTRQVSMELTVTVNASVEVTRVDVLPLTGSIPAPLWSRVTGHQETPPEEPTADTHCLLLLDLRNSWPSQMVIHLSSPDDGVQIEEHILPGNTSRVVLPIRRVYLEDPHAFIPALNPTRQRQFVVSTKISPEVERANREAFWYREKVLDTLRATWRTASAGHTPHRAGEMELRAVRFTARMIEAIKIDELDIDMTVVDPLSTTNPTTKKNTPPVVVQVQVDAFLELRVRVTNRSARPVYPLLRLTPALCHRPFNVSLDFTRKMAKFAWNGNLQQALPLLGPGGESVEVSMGVTALCRGEFEIAASVEEARLWWVKMHRPRILFLDAHDSFSNNITSLLTTLLDADVFVLPIDDPLLLLPTIITHDDDDDDDDRLTDEAERRRRRRQACFVAELARYDAVVCGPGPGNPDNEADVGLMALVWRLAESGMLPVLGVCLGFQSLVAAHGGRVGRLRRGLHGMVREIGHREGGGGGEGEGEGDIFSGVGRFRATLYHSLCGDVGQGEVVDDGEWEERKWRAFGRCPDLVPLAWVEEERDGGGRERILMAVKHRTKPFWGVQYHPESVCTEEEGNKVILNWFREAQRWNEMRGRVPVTGGHGLARAARKPSLLSQLTGGPAEKGAERQWWEVLGTDPTLHFLTVPLPSGVQVPDIVEAVDPQCSERIILDSANAAPTTSRADVRGRYSIIAAGLDQALHIEHHVGDSHATIKVGCLAGSPVNLSGKVPLADYGDVWGLISAFHEARRLPAAEPAYTPFVGGFMGYTTYELGLGDIGVSLEQPRPHHRPDVSLVWVTKSIVVDHLQQVVHIQHLSSGSMDRDTWVDKTADKLRSLQNSQRRPSFASSEGAPQSLPPKTRRPSRSASVQPPQTKEYEAKVRICQEYIAAGETYELCLTDQTTLTRPLSDDQQQRHSSPPHPVSSSWALFKRLRKHQPAPFASYLRLGSATLVSASPERFLTYDRGGRCSMRPMKGTVRKSDAVSTLVQAEAILHVPKEEAENLMIVDLVRHDLHGVCGAGNVTVPELLKVEEYQSVFQMITVVEGQLPPPSSSSSRGRGEGEYTGLDVLAASLPPGSMTGAPKKRSCEILREIEGHKERGLYSGVVGYMCATGRGDWSVTIRSLFRWDDEQMVVNGEEGPETHEVWRIGAGGAVTILSTPEGEREEMFTKLAGPLRIFGEEPCRW